MRISKYVTAGGIAALMVLSGAGAGVGAWAGVAVGGAGAAGASTTTTSSTSVQSRVLTLSDLPTGWQVSPTTPTDLLTQKTGSAVGIGGCANTTTAGSPGDTASATFEKGSFPRLSETLGTGATAVAAWTHLTHVFNACRVVGIKTGSGLTKLRVRPLAFPHVGDRSSAHLLTGTWTGVSVGLDVVTFKVGSTVGVINYTAPGRPNVAALKPIVRAAVAKAAGTTTTATT